MPWIKQLHLQQFRQFTDQTFSFGPPVTVITGPNGSGKSTVLEAVCLLSQARSYRTSRDRELIRFAQPEARVTLSLQDGTELTVTLQVTADDRFAARFARNDILLKSRSAVLGQCPTVSFFLSDLQLARGSSEERRRWLDIAIAQQVPGYLRQLNDYEKVRRQKAQLLKTPELPNWDTQLSLWNEQLIRYAVPVLHARAQTLAALKPLAIAAYAQLAPASEVLDMTYRPKWCSTLLPPVEAIPPGQWPDLWETQMRQALISQVGAEKQRMTCLVGPHRDDVCLTLNAQDATAFASQGQQRSIVLALKHAELEWLHAHQGEWPVLLLDDVMAELDPERQRFLLGWFKANVQVILTTTHIDQGVLGLTTDYQEIRLSNHLTE